MPFCASCGAPVEGRFCAKCGTPLSADVPPAGAPPLGPGPQPGSAAGLSDNAAGALCYVCTIITGILFLVLAPYNSKKAVRFHAFQSIFLFVAWIVVVIALNILFRMMRIYFLSSLVELAFVGLWIYMMVTTYQGKTVVLPVIGSLAQQQAGTA